VTELADGTNLGKRQAKALVVVWKRKKIQLSEDMPSLAVINKYIQIGNNDIVICKNRSREFKLNGIQQCTGPVEKEISMLRYLVRSSACTRSDVVPCQMSECNSRLLPV